MPKTRQSVRFCLRYQVNQPYLLTEVTSHTAKLLRLNTLMSIASQRNISQSKWSNTRTFCPIWFKINSFQDHCTFAVNLTFLDAIARFPPKVASPIKFQNFPPTTKSVPRDLQGPLRPCMSKSGTSFFKHKTVISQKLTVGMTWNWQTKCPAYMCTMCQNFSSLPQAVPKLLPKVSIFSFFQGPCRNFLSRPSYCTKY